VWNVSVTQLSLGKGFAACLDVFFLFQNVTYPNTIILVRCHVKGQNLSFYKVSSFLVTFLLSFLPLILPINLSLTRKKCSLGKVKGASNNLPEGSPGNGGYLQVP